MKKLILPILCGIFALFFSGKPALKPACGPHFTINNLAGGSAPITVTSVLVENLTYGYSTTYNSPSFPIYYTDQGATFRITYYFNGSYTGCYVHSMYPLICDAGSFSNKTSLALICDAFDCGQHTVQINGRLASQPCFQCAP